MDVSSFFCKLAKCETSGDEVAICTIVKTSGSTPRKVGAKMLVYQDGNIFGTIGGGALEMKVIEDAISAIDNGKSQLFSHALVQDHGMCCGGTVEVFIEPMVKKKKLYIFGAGHIGKALAKFASELDFEVTVIDERKEAFTAWKSNGVSLIHGKHRASIRKVKFDSNTFIAVVTHKHAYDREIVALCADQPHAYLGMIGSDRKVAMAKKVFAAAGAPSKKQIDTIDWPMGLDIKAETPQEIAISIVAKLVDVRAQLGRKGN
ncbi:MAG: xanthine dehydrogenase accessory protein XdhC [Flavobacteriales bacterium]|nr:xanthine dehydrogenase accessory protein XdhC [Flavobacteriales bacterium]